MLARWVRNALANRELERAIDAVEVRVDARNFARRLREHGAPEAFTAELPRQAVNRLAAPHTPSWEHGLKKDLHQGDSLSSTTEHSCLSAPQARSAAGVVLHLHEPNA